MIDLKLSVIVPVAPSEDLSEAFIESLRLLPAGTEIISVTAEECCMDEAGRRLSGFDFRRITAGSGRALCLNAGAMASSGEYLWFLHADSRFDGQAVSSLLAAIDRNTDALLYFDLVFDDAPLLMKLNEWGVYFRIRCLDTPFGDQGFCIRKDIYNFIGGYPEDAPYGEDHLFVREAARRHVPVKPVRAVLYTSARKYRNNGWLRTTVLHLYLWRKQVYYDNKKHRKKT